MRIRTKDWLFTHSVPKLFCVKPVRRFHLMHLDKMAGLQSAPDFAHNYVKMGALFTSPRLHRCTCWIPSHPLHQSNLFTIIRIKKQRLALRSVPMLWAGIKLNPMCSESTLTSLRAESSQYLWSVLCCSHQCVFGGLFSLLFNKMDVEQHKVRCCTLTSMSNNS